MNYAEHETMGGSVSWKLFCWTCGGEIPTVIAPTEGYALPGYTRRGGCCCVETEASPVVRGCTDASATNFNPNATTEDGSCVYGALSAGCTNPIAQNFDPDAQTDDGLCIIYPHAVFTYVVDAFDVLFDAGLSTDDGTITGYSWDFGDGSAAGTGIAPSHTYAARGNYVVTLTVTDDDGNTDSTSQIIPITENAPPVACFVWSAAALVATFDGGCSTDSDGTIVSWAWNFGDGFTGTGETLNHTYATDGTYTITLTVTDDGGLTDFVQQSIAFSGGVLNVPPVAAFTHSETDLDMDVDANTSSDSDGVIVSWDWDYGDGGTGTGETDSHTYAAVGTYTVTLTVTDDGGATDMVSHDVVITEVLPDMIYFPHPDGIFSGQDDSGTVYDPPVLETTQTDYTTLASFTTSFDAVHTAEGTDPAIIWASWDCGTLDRNMQYTVNIHFEVDPTPVTAFFDVYGVVVVDGSSSGNFFTTNPDFTAGYSYDLTPSVVTANTGQVVKVSGRIRVFTDCTVTATVTLLTEQI